MCEFITSFFELTINYDIIIYLHIKFHEQLSTSKNASVQKDVFINYLEF